MVSLWKKTIFLCCILLSSSIVQAKWLIDNAQVLDFETQRYVEATLQEINSKTHSQSFIVIESTIRQPESMVADDLFDQLTQYTAGQNIEGTLLLIVTEDAAGLRRRVYLSTSGDTTIQHINDHTVAMLTEQFAQDMYGNQQYNRAVRNYVASLDETLSASPLSSTDIAGGGLAGLLSGLVAFFRTKRRYRLPERPIPAVWKSNTISELQQNQNDLIDRQTRVRMIATPQRPPMGGGMGGGSTTHYSGSGNRHGGGGRGF